MFTLQYKQDKEVVINNQSFTMNLAYDNVLRLIDLLNDKSIANLEIKVRLGLRMLLLEGAEPIPASHSLFDMDIEELARVFSELIEIYIQIGKKKEVKYDLLGNEIPSIEEKEEDMPYSITHDASFIFSSFYQAYGIDLIEERGKLSWEKFKALLEGLPEGTKFNQVIGIRTWKKPTKSDSTSSQMARLKEIYKLPKEGGDDEV